MMNFISELYIYIYIYIRTWTQDKIFVHISNLEKDPCRCGKRCIRTERCQKISPDIHDSTSCSLIYIYIYIYVCVCVCVQWVLKCSRDNPGGNDIEPENVHNILYINLLAVPPSFDFLGYFNLSKKYKKVFLKVYEYKSCSKIIMSTNQNQVT